VTGWRKTNPPPWRIMHTNWEWMMRKQDVLQFLGLHKQEITARFGVKRLALFGSTARDEAGIDSDVDVLVEFEGGETFRNFFDLQFFLEDNLHCKIDLVCADKVRPQILPYIEKDALYVA
jgi:predicted nucleotidyltransferase